MLRRNLSAVINSRLASVGVLVLAALLIGTGVVLARGAGSPALQVPVGTAFTYQGTLTDGGLPAAGPYDFQFEVYDDAGAGNQVGSTVVLQDVQVTNGRFTVIIDFGPGVFDGNSRWLEIAVRPGPDVGPFTVLNPRQELTPTPNAIRATSAGAADTAGTVPWTGLTGVPPDLADGDDDTTYSASTGLSLGGHPVQHRGELPTAPGLSRRPDRQMEQHH